MKREDSTILNKYGKDPGFKVPENYFDDFNKKMAAMLPDIEITPVDIKPTMWQRIKPLAYLAAMFAGVWCMMTVFNLRYYDEMKYDEMSEILGTSEGALKASYHHAVKKIEQFLGETN